MEDQQHGESSEQKNVCQRCGEPLNDGVKFCVHCGARIEQNEPKPSDEQPAEEVKEQEQPAEAHDEAQPAEEVHDKAHEEAQPAETHDEPKADEQPAEEVRFCMNCGAKLKASAAFCNMCGTSVKAFEKQEAAPVDEAAVKAEAQKNKKRKLSALLYLIGAAISIVGGFIFLCTDFMSLDMELLGLSLGPALQEQGLGIGAASQNGLGLIGVMFGAKSDLVDMGVNATLLGWAGWMYIVYILGMINHGICLALNVKGYKKGERPFKVVASAATMVFAGIGILILGAIAKSQANDQFENIVALLSATGGSEGAAMANMIELVAYLGFVGVGVLSIIGFGCTCAGYFISANIYPPKPKKREKPRGNARIYFIVDIVTAVLVIAAVIAPIVSAFSYNHDRFIKARPGDSGKQAIDVDEAYLGGTVGTTVISLEGLEYDGEYTFTLTTDDVGQAQLIGSVCLVYNYKVEGLSSPEIINVLGDSYLMTNGPEDTQSGKVTLTFQNNYDSTLDLAIVVGFMATGDMTVNYEWEFKAAI